MVAVGLTSTLTVMGARSGMGLSVAAAAGSGAGGGLALDHGQAHPFAVVAFFVADFVHDFLDDVDAQAAGANVGEVAALDVAQLDLAGAVLDGDDQAGAGGVGEGAELEPDAAVEAALVAVLHDVG